MLIQILQDFYHTPKQIKIRTPGRTRNPITYITEINEFAPESLPQSAPLLDKIKIIYPLL